MIRCSHPGKGAGTNHSGCRHNRPAFTRQAGSAFSTAITTATAIYRRHLLRDMFGARLRQSNSDASSAGEPGGRSERIHRTGSSEVAGSEDHSAW